MAPTIGLSLVTLLTVPVLFSIPEEFRLWRGSRGLPQIRPDSDGSGESLN